MPQQPPSEFVDFAATHNLIRPGDAAVWTPVTGGVSSDVWKLEAGGRTCCLKRAVPKLRVQADWRAPVERTLYEWRWFKTADALVPGSVPQPIALDEARSILAMAFIEDAPLWKTQLLAGTVDAAFAGAVGRTLARIHAGTAGRSDIADAFKTDELFFSLRLDPYLLEAGRRRPEVGVALSGLVERTSGTRIALVHGDVSPKNILIGSHGPVFLDAETAWFGDPAFDLAFCLNHLTLKRLVVPDRSAQLSESFGELSEGYLAGVDWEPREALEARAASLLPGLMLARVDGKSPVEYLPGEDQRDVVRGVAIPLLLDPPSALGEVRDAWDAALRPLWR